MLERFYLKELLSFEAAELEFERGLIVFTGPSGSGKSILMEAILATLGRAEARASLSELSVSWQLDEAEHGILNEDPNVLRHVKKEKVRYFINNQTLSKRTLSEISANYLKHLSLRDYSDFENEKLLSLCDRFVEKRHAGHLKRVRQMQETFDAYREAKKELETLEDEERRIVELKEFARFEIDKIDAIHPETGEDERLLEIKKALSKRDKIEASIQEAQQIFSFENDVTAALELLCVESGFFDDAMNELRSHFDEGALRLEELDDVDIESVLDRIEALSELKRRYGSIEAALEYVEEKRRELERYERIEVAKDELLHRVASLEAEARSLAAQLSESRKKLLTPMMERINSYLQELYLRPAALTLAAAPISASGSDRLELTLDATAIGSLSSGEFNRLRLAVLALWAEFIDSSSGVLMLDEIDANLSGEESMSVARVLRRLSRVYQIFVISHQPQLTAMGEQHFLVSKDEKSRVRVLETHERIEEIARMISGESITKEARLFAKDLLESARCVL